MKNTKFFLSFIIFSLFINPFLIGQEISIDYYGIVSKSIDDNMAKMTSDFQKPNRVHTLFYDEIENELDAPQTPINVLSDIENQALAFERELANAQIYDIPNASDIAPNHKISDDVEVITERFEKELEDLYEGRR